MLMLCGLEEEAFMKWGIIAVRASVTIDINILDINTIASKCLEMSKERT